MTVPRPHIKLAFLSNNFSHILLFNVHIAHTLQTIFRYTN